MEDKKVYAHEAVKFDTSFLRNGDILLLKLNADKTYEQVIFPRNASVASMQIFLDIGYIQYLDDTMEGKDISKGSGAAEKKKEVI